LVTTEPTLTRVEVLGSQKTVSSVSSIVIKGAVRSGYNGGALLDSSGGVIGTVLANMTQTFAATGGDVDAVGLALPSEALRAFLDEHGIEYQVGMKLPPKAGDRLRIDARPFMAQVGCWQ
jgi:S1-C subfamily serine protease